MAQIASWNGHTFEVGPQLIRSFEDFTLKGSCEAEDKKSGKQQYAKYKNGKPSELSVTVPLSAYFGVTDVRGEAMEYVKEACEGAADYFYDGTQKLFSAKLMLTSAEITEKVILPGDPDVWVSCKVKLTFKQGSGDGGKKKKSKKGKKKKGKGKGNSGSSNLTHFADHNELLKLAKDASRNKIKGAGLAAQEIFARTAQTSGNSATRKDPTTGRSVQTGGNGKITFSGKYKR